MTEGAPTAWESIRDIRNELSAMRTTQADNALRLVKVEERLAGIQDSLKKVENRQNWAVGILAAAFLAAVANWIIQGGLASVAKAAGLG